MKTRNIGLISVLMLLGSTMVHADTWTLNPEQSKLNFISIKKVNIAEVHSFHKLSGQLSDDGTFKVSIDLSSVDTGVDIRDSRMKEFLFNVVEFPKAVLSSKIDSKVINSMNSGETKILSVEAELDLHGLSKTLPIDVMVTKVSADELLVSSSHPIILNVGDFKLDAGVDKLKELAGLSDISHAVPVSFYITLNATK
ncbi:MAG TPA: YceI family protein [Methylophaga aminisulfidivorans]|uniref:YceI family protein n=1 Tax=Methylophaga aminisulfidivorans TaxID=230105 RepID=A0A7C1VNW5_9GAMM|nr:YceI family protein [Methylophaga aminisulfidivorans]